MTCFHAILLAVSSLPVSSVGVAMTMQLKDGSVSLLRREVVGKGAAMEENEEKNHARDRRARLYADPRLAKLFDQPRSISLIQVGANDDGIGDSNDPVTDSLGKTNVKGLLLEPNPPVFKMLQQNIQSQFGAPPRLIAANEAACPKESGLVSFYVVNDKFAQDFPKAPHWAKYELSSMSKQEVTQHWKTLQEFVHSEEEFSKYVEEEKVDCLTPADLMKRHTIQPAAVDLLEVDAEGYDGPIVTSFLGVDGFDPEIIIFEACHLTDDVLSDVLTLLVSRGYVHDCTIDAQKSSRPQCKQNVFASKDRSA